MKRPNDITIKSPSIPITIWGTGQRYEFVALIDSGADVCVIPRDVAELLGLDLSGKKEEARGIGGKVSAVQTTIHLELGKPHERYTINSLPVKVILDKGDEEIPVLLGRAAFFDKFMITFNQKEERVTLKANS